MINLINLSIEITQRCNMNCKHCIRGLSRPIDMNEEVIKSVLSDVCYIHALTLTGGEPTLNVRGMYQILSIIKKLDIPLGYFHVVTNGKKFSQAMIYVLDKYIDYCDYADCCVLALSNSQYHENTIDNINRYLSLYKKYIRKGSGVYLHKDIIRMGNALKNKIGSKPNMTKNGFVFTTSTDRYRMGVNFITNKNEIQVDSSVHISCTGEIMDSCALSYDEMDNFSFGNTFNKPLKNIIIQNEYKAPEYLKKEKCYSC